ncbi:MAG: NADH-quinone oxidoreductase subunit N [Fimbriimonadaceae bacterium]|jgi:NADH-quinone oxidoreductase subunit N|nr:NADH-quinone oxidoreductase subunit N [Fimbriimonadaceae bacterium]
MQSELYTIPSIDWSLVMPFIVVVITGVIGLLIEMFRPKQNNNAIVLVSLAGLAGAFALLIPQLGVTTTTTFAGMVLRDQFGVLLQLIIVAGAFLSLIFSEPYMKQRRIAHGEFYPMALWATSGAMLMVSSDNLLMIFVGLEVLSIALYCLAGLARDEQRSEEAALKYFLLGAFASAFLLYGIAFVYGITGSTSLAVFMETLARAPGINDLTVLFAITLLLVGFGFKTALVPFHQWTPDVYQGAPTNVTAFMSAVSKVAAFGAFARVLEASLPVQEFWMPALIVITILTMTVGNLAALVQKDVKRALGYSSIAHAGYVMVALLAYLQDPAKGSLGTVITYLAIYTFMTIGSFAVLSLTAVNKSEGTRYQDLYGLWNRAPLAAGCLVLFMVSLVGVPPTAGFLGKFQIFQDAMGAGLPLLAIALAINSFVSAYYYLQIVRAVFVDEEGALRVQSAPMNAGLRFALVICAVGVMPILFAPILSQGKQTVTLSKMIESGAFLQRPVASVPLNPEPGEKVEQITPSAPLSTVTGN